MHFARILISLILTPFVLVSLLSIWMIFLGFWLEYGDDILGIGFLFGWLALVFSVIYRLLS